ncbi:MAG: NAD(P)H-dependent oxidoreductase [Candidatus Bathyarchaeia archaeon]
MEPVQENLEEELRGSGWSVESILLHELDIRSCTGCFRCWNVTPGICTGVKEDDAEEITKKVINSKLVVFLTPLTFGGYSSELKKMIERLLGLLQPGMTLINGETHHLKRYVRYPSILSIAITEKIDDEEVQLFKTLGHRFSLNFYPPKHREEVVQADDDLKGRTRGILAEMEMMQGRAH